MQCVLSGCRSLEISHVLPILKTRLDRRWDLTTFVPNSSSSTVSQMLWRLKKRKKKEEKEKEKEKKKEKKKNRSRATSREGCGGQDGRVN